MATNEKRIENLLESDEITLGKAENGTFLCSIPLNGNKCS